MEGCESIEGLHLYPRPPRHKRLHHALVTTPCCAVHRSQSVLLGDFRRFLGGFWGVFGGFLGGFWGVFGGFLGGFWGVFGGFLGGFWGVFGGFWRFLKCFRGFLGGFGDFWGILEVF